MEKIQRTHIGVYAAVKQSGNILLIKKSRGPYTGSLDLPGGKLEFGELLEEGLKRELMEEVGITANWFSPLASLTYRTTYVDKGKEIDFFHIGFIYAADIGMEIPDLTVNDQDVNGAKWVPLAEIGNHNLSPFASQAVSIMSN